jgi:hypothetical protein
MTMPLPFTRSRVLRVRFIEKRCGTAGIERMLDHIKDSNPSLTQKEIMDILNKPRNFFKHLKNDSIDFSDEMNDFVFVYCLP